MKKILSVIMAVAMLFSCLAMSTSAMAETMPEIKIGTPVSFTLPGNGTEETSVKFAKFIPDETGSYVFECDNLYKNTPSPSAEVQLPGGIISVEYMTKDEQATCGMSFFLDTAYLKDEMIAEYKAKGMDLTLMNQVIFTADLEKGVEYTLMGYQDGNDAFSGNISVKKHTHTLKTDEKKVAVNKKGKSSTSGGVFEHCTDWFCAHETLEKEYPAISSTKVKSAVTYTGKALKPAVRVETEYGKKLSSKYYTVTYKNNKKVGKGTAIIKFRNGYTGTVKKYFKINPKKTAIKKATPGKKQLKVAYKKVAGVTGYQVQVATNKKFTKNKKTVTVKGAKKTSAIAKKLKGGKKYYVRVRAYKTVNGKKYYSSWSKIKTANVKK